MDFNMCVHITRPTKINHYWFCYINYVRMLLIDIRQSTLKLPLKLSHLLYSFKIMLFAFVSLIHCIKYIYIIYYTN